MVGSRDFTITQAAGQTGALAAGAGTTAGLTIYHYGTGRLILDTKLGGNSSATGTGSLSFYGTGLVDWTKAANSSGQVILDGVTLRQTSANGQLLGNGAAGFGSGNILLSNGGVWEISGGGSITRNIGTGAGAIQWNTDGGFSAHNGTLTVNLGGGTITWGTNANFVKGNNALVLSSSNADSTVDFQNNIDFDAVQRVVHVNNGSAAVDAVLSGNLSGGLFGGLVKEGAGTLNLSGTNTYTGATTVNAGTLQFAKTASLYNGTTASWTAPNIIVNSGGTLALNVGGAGEFTSANVDTLDSLGGASNGFRNNSTLALDTTNAGGSFTHSGNISNTNSGSNVLNLTKLGTGTLALTGNNTYTGATTITAGTLQISSAGRLGGGSYSGNISNSGTFIYEGTNNQTLSGVISGSGALTQNGTGTLTLTGNNTGFTGTTTIASGTLQAASANALGGTTNIDVNGGSLLVAVANAVNSNANINLGGGTLAFGSAGYNGSVGALTLSADSILDLGTSSNGVLIRFNSINWSNSNALLSIYNWTGTTQWQGGTGNNLDQVYFTNTNLSDEQKQRISFYSDFGQSFVGDAFQIQGGTFAQQIIAVPEPETYLTGVILLLGLSIHQLRLARQGRGLLSRLTFLRQRGQSPELP
jgi:autotransporter-associated beta strand protein